MPKPLKKQKEIKAWAVVYGSIDRYWLKLTPNVSVPVLAIFRAKKEAETYAELNAHQSVLPITLKL